MVAVGFLIAVLGYGWVGTIEDPGAMAAIPAMALLGAGLTSTVLTSTLLLGKEAPVHIRGSVFGLQNFFGALGILVISAGGGRLFDSIGPHAPFIVMAIANGVVMLCAIGMRWSERHQTASATA
jgi:hypothetical protein